MFRENPGDFMAAGLAARPPTVQREELSMLEDDELLKMIRGLATRGRVEVGGLRGPDRALPAAGPVMRPAVPEQPRVRGRAHAGRVHRPAQGDQQLQPGLRRQPGRYAQPCVTGEIKRHFRDKRWQVHVRRSAQELLLQVRAATEDLTQRLGHTPADDELPAHLGVEPERAARGPPGRAGLPHLLAGRAGGRRPGAVELADLLGADDEDLGRAVRHGRHQRPLE